MDAIEQGHLENDLEYYYFSVVEVREDNKADLVRRLEAETGRLPPHQQHRIKNTYMQSWPVYNYLFNLKLPLSIMAITRACILDENIDGYLIIDNRTNTITGFCGVLKSEDKKKVRGLKIFAFYPKSEKEYGMYQSDTFGSDLENITMKVFYKYGFLYWEAHVGNQANNGYQRFIKRAKGTFVKDGNYYRYFCVVNKPLPASSTVDQFNKLIAEYPIEPHGAEL